MFYSTRSKLIVCFASVTLLLGGVCLAVGWHLFFDSVVTEAYNRIGQDLNVARLIYQQRMDAVRLSLQGAGSAPQTVRQVMRAEPGALTGMLAQVMADNQLDFAGLLRPDGGIMVELGQSVNDPEIPSRPYPVASQALSRNGSVTGTCLVREEGNLYMSIGAAVFLGTRDKPAGVLYGGVLLNGNTAIVDRIVDTVFHREKYKGRVVGGATIFFQDTRIATTIRKDNGERAVGTRATRVVTDTVLGQGKGFRDRAFVVNDWYITAYEPILDIMGKRVGMLYVGALESKYRDVRWQTFWIFSAITLAGVLVAVGLGWWLARYISRPIHQLVLASDQIAGGNLTPDLGPGAGGEIGLLQSRFKEMSQALKAWDRARNEESENQLIKSEKQAVIGKLAAGLAHEINNPLTPVLTFTHLLLARKDLPDDVKKDLTTIADQTQRVRGIVKGLLDFSRQQRLNRDMVAPEKLLNTVVNLMENQALVKGVTLTCRTDGILPETRLDRDQIQVVLVNMVINALDATPSGGQVSLFAKSRARDGEPGISIDIRDSGEGIAPEHLDMLFDPFFSTKPVGKGTGLGLSISFGIIQRHGGFIDVNSTPGEGACFTIWLPCAKDPRAYQSEDGNR